MKNPLLLVLSSLVLTMVLAAGQNTSPTATQIQTGTQPGSPAATPLDSTSNIRNIPELYPGESNDFGTQEIVKEKTHRKWVELDLNWQYGYNDNYLLTNLPNATVSGGKPQTMQMLSTWDAAFAPDSFTYEGIKLSPRIGFRQSFWNYGIGTGQNSEFAVYDFDTQTVYGDLRSDLGDGWATTLGADWTRITSSFTDSEIYRQEGPHWGVEKQFGINDYNSVILTFDQQYLFTEVADSSLTHLNNNIYDRFNNTLGVSYLWSPVDRLFIVPFYRLVYSYYPQYAVANIFTTETEDRSDFTNTLGLSVSYQVNDFITARMAVSYEKRYTTFDSPVADPNHNYVPEYGNFQSSLGGGVVVRF